MSEARKLCIDCKFYADRLFSPSLCAAPQCVSVVTGKPVKWCEPQRNYEADVYCGPSGKWFVAKNGAKS